MTQRKAISLGFASILALVMAAACSGDDGPQGIPGRRGATGATGANGMTGTTGAPGATGASGQISLIRQSDEPAGANCATGGKRLEFALDSNGNGVVDTAEIKSTAYVCNGTAGNLTRTSTLVVGDEHCPLGGVEIDVGVDANGNGILDTAELSASYVCSSAAGAKGDTGATGPAGANGVNGNDGATGPTGATGPAGANGVNGNDGATGPTGATGPAGTNGVNGNDGATGPTGATGPAGTNGVNGNDGATGPTGATGPAGANGVNGNDGATGPTGATGPAGTNGVNGNDGATGPTGATGPAGANGVNGNDGATGPTGATGPAGTNGVNGNDGATGATGDRGATGATGPMGATGATGPAGATGATGDRGATGPAGATGATGATGSSVASGVQVLDGNNVVLGKLLEGNASGLTILTSSSHVLTLAWDLSRRSAMIDYTLASCGAAGSAYLYDNDTVAGHTMWGKAVVWSGAWASYMVPATVSPTTGMSTTAAYSAVSTEDASHSCYAYSVASAYGWLLTRVTNAALGLPATLVTPLKLQ